MVDIVPVLERELGADKVIARGDERLHDYGKDENPLPQHYPPDCAVLVGSNLLRSQAGLNYLGEVLRNRAENAVDRNQPEVAARYRATYESFRRRCPQPPVQ